MTDQAATATARQSVSVPLTPERAFALFVGEFDSWWPKSSHTTAGDAATVVLEPRPEGRWGELDSAGEYSAWGRVLAVERPSRILLAWQLDPDFKLDPDTTMQTEVEVTFEPEGEDGTRVTLEHRGFEVWGERGAGMRDSVDAEGGWSELLGLYAEVAAR
jgi:uncharacterized protein YndB with AHSA1/START domain